LNWKRENTPRGPRPSHSSMFCIEPDRLERLLGSSSRLRHNCDRGVACAFEISDTIKRICTDRPGNPRVRVGCASGTIIGGIVSRYKFVFDIFGPAAENAEFLSSVPGDISLCEQTAKLSRRLIEKYTAVHPGCELTQNISSGKHNLNYLTLSCRGAENAS